MGLDLVFDRKQAEEAGLQFEVFPNNGTYDEGDDPEYIEWCKGSEEVIKIPNADHYVSNDSVNDQVVNVRANKWGNTYHPLTAWLKEHNIPWSEF